MPLELYAVGSCVLLALKSVAYTIDACLDHQLENFFRNAVNQNLMENHLPRTVQDLHIQFSSIQFNSIQYVHYTDVRDALRIIQRKIKFCINMHFVFPFKFSIYNISLKFKTMNISIVAIYVFLSAYVLQNIIEIFLSKNIPGRQQNSQVM